MWGGAFARRGDGSAGCWDWKGGSKFWQDTLRGTTCDRNWLEGAIGGPEERLFDPPSPALFGFDESINELCSELIGWDAWDNGDLNHKIAERCRRAHRNVLRLLGGSDRWDMCQNLQWQMCALQGKLPGQDGDTRVAFATAPRALLREWWDNPSSHPTWGCCGPNKFSVGDVYFAEVAVTYSVCRNRAVMFSLDEGEFFRCDLDVEAYEHLAMLLDTSRR